MRKTGIAVVTGIVIVIILVVLLPLKPGQIPPIIQDQPEIEDQIQLGVGIEASDTPTISDSFDTSKESGYDFYIDEKGVKHYIINARDAPNLEG